MKRIAFMLAIIILSGLTFSCKDNIAPNGPSSKFDHFSQILSQYTGDYYTKEQLKEMYNNGNLTGVIIFYKQYRNDLTLTGGTSAENAEYTPYDGYATDARGIFFTPGTYEDMQLGAFELNADAMRQYQDGYYTPYHDNIDIHMGDGWNKFIIDPYDSFPGAMDSVMFANEIRIQGLNRLDTINISDTSGTNGLDLHWTGGSLQGKIQIDIEKNNIFYDTLDGNTGIGLVLFIDNTTDNHHIDNRWLYETIGIGGLYDVILTYYEPHYVTLSNGRQLLLVGESAHKITVYLQRSPQP